MDSLILATGLATGLAFIRLGGGFYEYSVVDPYWPSTPAIVQPAKGGVRRVWFWLPAHIAFELCLLTSLALGWSLPPVRQALLIALASHAAMRIWSAFDFIPKALAFEKAETVDAEKARSWTRRSLLRMPLDLITSGAVMTAFALACRSGLGAL